MQGPRERGPAEPGPPGLAGPGLASPGLASRAARGQDGHVETVLQRGMLGHAELGQQAAVSRAATEEDMLAGVDDQAVPVKGAGRAAEPGPGLEQRDVGARLRERDRGGDPRQPAADHHNAAPHAILPARAFTATAAFSPADSDIRPLSTAAG